MQMAAANCLRSDGVDFENARAAAAANSLVVGRNHFQQCNDVEDIAGHHAVHACCQVLR